MVRTSPLPALLPQLSLQDRQGGSRPSRRGSRSRPPLRLPQLPEPVRRDVVFAMSRLDSGGRIMSSIVLTSLAWPAGERLGFAVRDGLIIIHPQSDGIRAVGTRCLLRLPIPVRRACRLQDGDQLLLAALPARQSLIVHPPVTLMALTADLHERVAGGDPV
jgi:hypothetical protein